MHNKIWKIRNLKKIPFPMFQFIEFCSQENTKVSNVLSVMYKKLNTADNTKDSGN